MLNFTTKSFREHSITVFKYFTFCSINLRICRVAGKLKSLHRRHEEKERKVFAQIQARIFNLRFNEVIGTFVIYSPEQDEGRKGEKARENKMNSFRLYLFISFVLLAEEREEK